MEVLTQAERQKLFVENIFPYKHHIKRKIYEKQKYHLQIELLKLQKWIKENNKKLLIISKAVNVEKKHTAKTESHTS